MKIVHRGNVFGRRVFIYPFEDVGDPVVMVGKDKALQSEEWEPATLYLRPTNSMSPRQAEEYIAAMQKAVEVADELDTTFQCSKGDSRSV